MHNETIARQNRVLTPILLAVTIFFLIFITKSIYLQYMEKSTTFTSVETNRESKVKMRDELLKIQAEFASRATTDIAKKVEKINKKFEASDIMETIMLNDFTKTGVGTDAKIAIGSISVDKGAKLPSGLSLGHVSFNVSGTDMYDVIDYITYLTTNSSYAFTLDDIILPIDTAPSESLTNGGKFSLSLSIGIYYYE
ncbi:MAG: hypothetical protein PHY14_00300 [Candidatus Gracilibacteria bacterium]|nr:hypothetical protein [Candidatus Gracilibacteria bacterium]